MTSGWQTSSRSGQSGDNCVEVTLSVRRVAVRDSTDRTGPTLVVTSAAWRAFLDGVRAGEFDRT